MINQLSLSPGGLVRNRTVVGWKIPPIGLKLLQWTPIPWGVSHARYLPEWSIRLDIWGRVGAFHRQGFLLLVMNYKIHNIPISWNGFITRLYKFHLGIWATPLYCLKAGNNTFRTVSNIDMPWNEKWGKRKLLYYKFYKIHILFLL